VTSDTSIFFISVLLQDLCFAMLFFAVAASFIQGWQENETKRKITLTRMRL